MAGSLSKATKNTSGILCDAVFGIFFPKKIKNQHYLLLPESPKAMIGQTGMLFILI